MSEEPKPPIMDYNSLPASKSVGWTVLGGFAGVGGYAGLAVTCLYLGGALNVSVVDWRIIPLTTLPPLGVMTGASYLFKSKSMLIASLIMFGVTLLGCGSCYAMLSSIFHSG